MLITRQPSANIIDVVDSVRALLPELQAELPADVQLSVASDSTNSIRSSLREVELTLIISVILVVLVVSAFLRSPRATVVPAVATVVSLLGTFGVMYLLGYSLDNLSLMALTVATGFVVDDAIVVLENTSRHIEAGLPRMQAALLGAREVGFTVLSISLSLVAVFIPLLFMGGQVGRLFREFAVTLSVAVLISLVISLTTTPMMCAWLLKPGGAPQRPPGRLARGAERAYDWVLRRYEASLDWALASKGAGDADPARGRRAQRLPVLGDPEGLLPAAGQRTAVRRDARRPEHLVAGDGREAAPGGGHHPPRPGGRHGGRLHRRLARRRRLHVRQPEAGGAAPRHRLRGDRAAAAAARRGHRAVDLPQPGAGGAFGRALEQLDLPVHLEERQPGRLAQLGQQARRCDEGGSTR